MCLGRSGASPNVDFCVPDRFPQIIHLASELEFNLGSEPVVSCMATGNPLPTSDSVELRKADGTVLKVLPCPCPTNIPILLAPSKAPISPVGCWAASGWWREPGGSWHPLWLQLIKAIIESGQITCEFQVRRLTKADTGLWECRVSTTGGQDSRKVKVNIRGEKRVGLDGVAGEG